MGSVGGIFCKQGNFVINMISRHQYSTTFLKMVLVTFNFLATRFRATLRGFLGGASRLASRLVG
jgi:hypothetical protein